MRTCCSEHQRGEVLRGRLQSSCSAQRVCVHGGDEAVEAGQSAGLNALHPERGGEMAEVRALFMVLKDTLNVKIHKNYI